jgi:hypothetical protein
MHWKAPPINVACKAVWNESKSTTIAALSLRYIGFEVASTGCCEMNLPEAGSLG